MIINNVFRWLGFNKKDSQDMNALTVLDYYDRLRLIALSLFEWENLPESCNARFLEQTLYTYGRALFINDDTLGYLNTKTTPSGQLNHYDEPVNYTAYSTVFNKQFDRDSCVLIRNNQLERPTDNTIILFATRLAGAERTIDVNINAQKTPVLVRTDEKTRLTMVNLYKQYDGNEPFIVGEKSLDPNSFSVFKTDAPFVADKLQIYKQQIWNEALTFFGINNTNSEKRERLITVEAEANNEVININAQSMLLTRLEACDKINKMYDLNVNVKLRSLDNVDFNLNYEEMEGEEDGEIHS